MNRNFTEINNSSAIDAGLISLLKTNRYGTPGAFFCDLFESRTKLDTLRSLNQENTPQAKRISGLLENLNSIEAYALSIGITWEIMIEELQSMMKAARFASMEKCHVAIADKQKAVAANEAKGYGGTTATVKMREELEKMKLLVRFHTQIEKMKKQSLENKKSVSASVGCVDNEAAACSDPAVFLTPPVESATKLAAASEPAAKVPLPAHLLGLPATSGLAIKIGGTLDTPLGPFSSPTKSEKPSPSLKQPSVEPVDSFAPDMVGEAPVAAKPLEVAGFDKDSDDDDDFEETAAEKEEVHSPESVDSIDALSAKLKQMMKHFELSHIADCTEMADIKKARLGKLEVKGEGATDEAELLKADLKKLDQIEDLHIQIVALSTKENQSNTFGSVAPSYAVQDTTVMPTTDSTSVGDVEASQELTLSSEFGAMDGDSGIVQDEEDFSSDVAADESEYEFVNRPAQRFPTIVPLFSFPSPLLAPPVAPPVTVPTYPISDGQDTPLFALSALATNVDDSFSTVESSVPLVGVSEEQSPEFLPKKSVSPALDSLGPTDTSSVTVTPSMVLSTNVDTEVIVDSSVGDVSNIESLEKDLASKMFDLDIADFEDCKRQCEDAIDKLQKLEDKRKGSTKPALALKEAIKSFDEIIALYLKVQDMKEAAAKEAAERESHMTEAVPTSLDIATLDNEINAMMIEMGIDTIEDCIEKVQEAKIALEKLVNDGKGQITKARRLEDDIMQYEMIISLHNEREALLAHGNSSSLEVYDNSEITGLLKEQGLDSMEECIAQLKLQQQDLQRLEQKGSGKISKAEKIRACIAALQFIVDRHNEISKSSTADSSVVATLTAEMNTLMEDEDIDSIDSCRIKLAAQENKLKTLSAKSSTGDVLRESNDALRKIISKHNEIKSIKDSRTRTSVPKVKPKPPVDDEISSKPQKSTQSSVRQLTLTAANLETKIPARPALTRDTSVRSVTKEEDLQLKVLMKQLIASAPECAEKTAEKLYLLFKDELDSRSEEDQSDFALSADFGPLSKQLSQQILTEELKDSTVKGCVQQINELTYHSSVTALKELHDTTFKLWKHLQPLNVALLLQRLEGSLYAAHRIRGKDIVLLIGGTGAGKSATIHWLGGSEMEETICNDLLHIAPVRIKLPDLEAVTTSPLPRSETRAIIDVRIPLSNGRYITVCDAPGFGDTDGVEVDIANGMGVVKVLRACNSVKPLILISKLTIGDRLQGLPPLIKMLIMLIPKLQDHLDGFSYGFTKYKKFEHAGIQKLLQYFQKNPHQEANTTEYKALLADLIAKTKSNISVIDPIKDTPEIFLNALANSSRIEAPADVFNYFVSLESLSVLKDQLNRHRASVFSALHRNDIQLLVYKMEQLKLLCSGLEFDDCKFVYEECVQECIRSIQALLKLSKERMTNILSDSNSFVDSDIKYCVDVMLQLGHLERIRAVHCKEESNLGEVSINMLLNAQQELLKGVLAYQVQSPAKVLIPVDCSPENMPIDYYGVEWRATCPSIDVLTIRMMKMRSFCLAVNQTFKILEKDPLKQLFVMYNSGCEFINRCATRSVEVAQTSVMKCSWKTVVNELDRLLAFRVHLSAFTDEKYFADLYTLVIKTVECAWASLTNQSEEILKGVVTEQNALSVGSYLQVLRDASNTEGLSKHIPKEIPLDERDRIISAVNHYVEIRANTIERQCQREDVYYPALLELLNNIVNVRCTPEFIHSSAPAYDKATDCIRRRLLSGKEHLFDLVTQVFGSSDSCDGFDSDHFTRKILELNGAKCFLNHKSGIFNKEFKSIKELLMTKFNEVLKKYQDIELGVGEIVQLKAMNEKVLCIGRLSGCFEVIPDVGKLYEQIQRSFESLTQSLLRLAAFQFSVNNFKVSAIKEGLMLLRAVKLFNNINNIPTIEGIEMAFDQFMEEMFDSFQQRWTVNFAFFTSDTTHPVQIFATATDNMLSVSKDLTTLVDAYTRIPCTPMEITTTAGHQYDFYSEFFFNRPSAILSEWHKTSLPGLIVALDAVVQSISSPDILLYNLTVTQQLRKLDEFVAIQPTFGELSIKFQNAITANNTNTVRNIEMAVQTERYTDFVEALKVYAENRSLNDPEVSKILSQVNETISNSISSVGSTFMRMRLEDSHSVSEFAKLFNKTVLNCEIVRDYLIDSSSTFERLEKIESEFCRQLYLQLDTADKYCNSDSFHKCEPVLITVSDIGQLLLNIFEKSSFLERSVKPFIAAIDKKRNTVRKFIADLAEERGKQDLNLYAVHLPVEFYDRLQSIECDDKFYEECLTKYTNHVVHTIVDIMDDARKKSGGVKVACMREVSNCLIYLPKKILGIIDGQWQSFKVVVEAAIEEFNRENQTSSNSSIKASVARLFKFVDSGELYEAKQCQLALRKLFTSVHDKVMSELALGNIQNVLTILSPSWIHWVQYIDQLPKINVPTILFRWMSAADYAHLKSDTESRAQGNSLKHAIRAAIEKVCADIENADSWKVYDMKVPHLLYFLKFKKTDMELGAKCLYCALMGDTRDKIPLKRIKDCIMTVVSWLHKNSIQFNDQLTTDNSDDLKALHDNVFDSHSLYLKFQEFLENADTKNIAATELPDLSKIFHFCLSYKDVRARLAGHITNFAAAINQPFLDNKATMTEQESDRDSFYVQQFAIFTQFKRLRYLSVQINTDESVGVKDEKLIYKNYEIKLKDVYQRLVDLISSVPTTDVTVYTRIKIWNDNFRSFIDNFKDPTIQPIAEGYQRSVLDRLLEKLLMIINEVTVYSDSESIAVMLMKVKQVGFLIPAFQKDVDKQINTFLNSLKEAGVQNIGMLGAKLNADKTNKDVSQRLINEHSVFEGYAHALRNAKTASCTIDHVVEKLRINTAQSPTPAFVTPAKKAELLDLYKEFDKEYWSLVEAGLIDKTQQAKVIDIAIQISSAMTKATRAVSVRKLLAHIFAWWTLSQSKHYTDALDNDVSEEEKTEGGKSADPNGIQSHLKKYIVQPHAAQIVSIFRLLGVDNDSGNDPKTGMSNHLIQVGTGEGKSVILAITATTLAMMGYEVYCGCYSQYLSERDCASFDKLFKAFAVGNYVHYGSFNRLCENYINKNGDVRELVETALNNKPIGDVRKRSSPRGQILLIDEVDVFFNKDFYGNVYKSLTKLTDLTITKFINYMWASRDNPSALRFDALKSHPLFQAVLDRFKGWSDLMVECLKNLLDDLKTFESQDYVVLEGKIGYKDQDAISFDAFYGYKTLFAHYKEVAAKRVTNSILQSKIALYIDCGNFSYAEIPKQYIHVMGVTGTLETLSEPKRELLAKEYNIRKSTFTPSVYGENQLIFNKTAVGVMIESSGSFFNAIRNEITTRLRSVDAGSQTERAVLVFFDTKTNLMNFFNSSSFVNLKGKCKVMTEEVSATNKEGMIRQAVTSGAITLLTREFGRGTDFICYDENLLAAGGVHVIQTFVSEEVSEETQIMGRTARQGNKGSFSMVLLDGTLEPYGIDNTVIQNMKNTGMVYQTINQKRNDWYKKQYPKEVAYVSQILADHQESTAFLASLVEENLTRVRQFLFDRNKSLWKPTIVEVCRTLVLMDATGSMGDVLTEAKQKVKNMFANAYSILSDAGFEAAIQIQFAVYRNYNVSHNQLLQYSSWASKPDELIAFIDSIGPNGGMGNEAIEIGFWHVNNEIAKGKVSQVILIGDMPPNLDSEIPTKRVRVHDEQYWSTTAFKTPTYFQPELDKIVADKVPVHCFYVHDHAREMFTQMAAQSHGRSYALDVKNSEEDNLTHLITMRVLDQAGGVDHGARLVDAYKAKFCRGHVFEAKN